MTTGRSDLIKAKVLLLVFSGKECKIYEDDSDWVLCNGVLYRKYIVDELLKDGHLLLEKETYVPSTTLYNWNWLED